MAWRCSSVLHRKRTDNSHYCAFYTSTMLFALLLHNFAIESLSINCCRLWVQRFNCVRHSLYSSVSNLDFYVLSLISLTFLLHHYVAFGKEYIINRPIVAECRMRWLNQASFVLPYFVLFAFYRAMHFSAKRGIAIACRLSVPPSVCLSVCNVGELWSHRLEFFENNFTIS